MREGRREPRARLAGSRTPAHWVLKAAPVDLADFKSGVRWGEEGRLDQKRYLDIAKTLLEDFDVLPG